MLNWRKIKENQQKFKETKKNTENQRLSTKIVSKKSKIKEKRKKQIFFRKNICGKPELMIVFIKMVGNKLFIFKN